MERTRLAAVLAAAAGKLRIVASQEATPPYRPAHMVMLFECPCGHKHVGRIAGGVLWIVCPQIAEGTL